MQPYKEKVYQKEQLPNLDGSERPLLGERNLQWEREGRGDEPFKMCHLETLPNRICKTMEKNRLQIIIIAIHAMHHCTQ